MTNQAEPVAPAEPVSTELLRRLRRELRLFAERARHLPVGRWPAPAGPFPTRADAAFHLAEVIAGAALAAEHQPPRRLPRLDPVAVPDQIDVVGYDLLAALADPPAAIDWQGRRWDAIGITAAVLAEVLLHRGDLDAAAPPPDALAELAGVGEWAAISAAPRDHATALQQLARARCPGHPDSGRAS